MDFWREFHGTNAAFVLERYDRYRRDPNSVDAATRAYFAHWTPPREATAAPPQPVCDQIMGVVALANAIRAFGHLAAHLDPLGSAAPGDPELEAAAHDVTEEDLRRLPASLVGGPVAERTATAFEAIAALRTVYSSATGYGYAHIHAPRERDWLRIAAESGRFRPPRDPIDQAALLARITRQEGEEVKIGEVLGLIEEASAARPATPAAEEPTAVGAPPGRTTAPADTGVMGPPPIPRPSPLPGAVQQGTRPSPPAVPAVGAARAAVATERTSREERVRMSRRRLTIARRLVEAQQTASMLTTFNEVDMGPIQEIRSRRKESFRERHGVGLGITAFFVKAAIASLKSYPRLNAEIQDEEIVLKRYYDIGVAVDAPEGLVVPVLRDADRLSIAEIEGAIRAFVQKTTDGTLSLDDLRGGTFTITNGGVFGSLFSTPILNPPQVGVLGLHKIEERPVARSGAVAVRPMMYVALTYDHRIVDGREAVEFLVRIKELIERPDDLLLEG